MESCYLSIVRLIFSTKNWLKKWFLNVFFWLSLIDKANCYKNFNNFPNVIDGELNIANNRFKSLKGLPIIKGYLYLSSNPLEDITDLSVDDMIKNLKNKQFGIESIKRKVIDNYFEFYINKDIRIVKALEKYISNDMKDKYKHYYEANKFDIF